MFLKGSIKSLTLYNREEIEKSYHKATFNTPSEIVKIVSGVHLLYVKNMFIYYYMFSAKYLGHLSFSLYRTGVLPVKFSMYSFILPFFYIYSYASSNKSLTLYDYIKTLNF